MSLNALQLTFENGRFILHGTVFGKTDEIPRGARFRWESSGRYWWTDSPTKAQHLVQYATPECLAVLTGCSPSTCTLQRAHPAPVTQVVGTEQQNALWSAVENLQHHLVLRARAGTGKTFSICHAATLIKSGRIGFSAFNAAIAQELKGRVPASASAFTLHSLGRQAIVKATGNPNIIIYKEGEKVDGIVKNLLANERREEDKTFASSVGDFSSLCKNYLLPGTPTDLEWLLQRHDISLDPSKRMQLQWLKECPAGTNPDIYIAEQTDIYQRRIFDIVPKVLSACKSDTNTIDFDDMIWLPVVLGMPVRSFDYLFVDEAQDMNKCQQALAMSACPNGRVIVVGDDLQSIYGFRGADIRSIDNMKERLADSHRGVVEYPLTETRRCPRLHVADVWDLVPDIRALPDAAEGDIRHIRMDQVPQQAKAGDMVICRTNAPLLGVAYGLIRIGKKPILKGRDVEKRLQGFIASREAHNVQELCEKVASFRTAETARLVALGKSAQMIANVQDLCEMVEVLAEGCREIYEIEAKIQSIFSCADSENGVQLSSVHGSKGLEAECVFILRPDLLPHPAAKSDEDIQQENNIAYVAKTRSKNLIVYAHLNEVPDNDVYLRCLREKAEMGSPDSEEKCACGATMQSLYEFFGSDLSTHVTRCRQCGGELHVTEDFAKCVSCKFEDIHHEPDTDALYEAACDSSRPEDIREDDIEYLPVPWQGQVSTLLAQAMQLTPFDEAEVNQALENAMSAVLGTQRRSNTGSLYESNARFTGGAAPLKEFAETTNQ